MSKTHVYWLFGLSVIVLVIAIRSCPSGRENELRKRLIGPWTVLESSENVSNWNEALLILMDDGKCGGTRKRLDPPCWTCEDCTWSSTPDDSLTIETSIQLVHGNWSVDSFETFPTNRGFTGKVMVLSNDSAWIKLFQEDIFSFEP